MWGTIMENLNCFHVSIVQVGKIFIKESYLETSCINITLIHWDWIGRNMCPAHQYRILVLGIDPHPLIVSACVIERSAVGITPYTLLTHSN